MENKEALVLQFFDDFLNTDDAEKDRVEKSQAEEALAKLSEVFIHRGDLINKEISAVVQGCETLKQTLDSGASAEPSQVGNLSEKLAAARQRKHAALEDLARSKAEAATCRLEREALVARREALAHQVGNTIPRRRQDMNLCLYLSGIRWQDDCEPNEVMGYVSNKGSVKPFCLDSNQNSKFFIANYLWDQMKVDW